MPLFACWCVDGPGGETIRHDLLAEHLAHVESHLDDYLVAGPLRDDEHFFGSLLVLKAESLEDARAKLMSDPYAQAGLWDDIRIEPYRAVAGDWVGGATWKNRA